MTLPGLSGLALTLAMTIAPMRWFERNKERERFYLLPGMGGRALRRKNRRFLAWAIVAGLFISAIVACILYVISGR